MHIDVKKLSFKVAAQLPHFIFSYTHGIAGNLLGQMLGPDCNHCLLLLWFTVYGSTILLGLCYTIRAPMR